jgi:hypothetical protein
MSDLAPGTQRSIFDPIREREVGDGLIVLGLNAKYFSTINEQASVAGVNSDSLIIIFDCQIVLAHVVVDICPSPGAAQGGREAKIGTDTQGGGGEIAGASQPLSDGRRASLSQVDGGLVMRAVKLNPET